MRVARSSWLRRLCWPIALAALAAVPAARARADGYSLADAIKATYVYKFAPFVQWPPSAFASASSPVDICVAGAGGFADVIESAVAGQLVGDRPIVLRRLAEVSGKDDCQILFAADSDDQSAAQMLALVHGQPVLTVTDAARSDAKGIVHFVIIADRVRFEVDDEAAAENGLTISSKVLSLAIHVRPRT